MSDQNKIFIGNLSFATTESKVRESFEGFGSIVDVSIPVNRETGRSRGFAFLTFESGDAIEGALTMDGKDVDGRNIRVSVAHNKERSGGGGGDRRGGGGGFGGGGGGGYRDNY